LASSALIGAVLFECAAGAVSANKVDPASATAMSGPRALMIVFMAALSDLTVFGGRNEPPMQMNRSRRKLPPGQKNRLPTRMMVHCPLVIGRLQRLLLDGHSVCYWTGCSVYCVWSGSHIVLFLQRSKIFF
jgi:hypothetical protein